MDITISLIVKAIIVGTVGYAIVRMSGKKSVSQMTMPQMVIMLTLGTILAQPITSIVNNSLMFSFISVGTLILVMMLFEWLTVKLDSSEGALLSRPVTLIRDGRIQVETLRKERLTVDTLEGFLREKGIKNINNCKNVTLEENGKIGYELKKEFAPITYKDCYDLINQVVNNQSKQNNNTQEPTIFDETYYKNDAKSKGTELE